MKYKLQEENGVLLTKKQGRNKLYNSKNENGKIRSVNATWVRNNISNIVNATIKDGRIVYKPYQKESNSKQIHKFSDLQRRDNRDTILPIQHIKKGDGAYEQRNQTSSRKESREQFLERTRKKGLELYIGTTTAYAYRRVGRGYEKSGLPIQKELTKLKVPCEIIQGSLEYNVDGLTRYYYCAIAITAGEDVIFINGNLDMDCKEVIGHELFHFWKNTNNRNKYIEILKDNILLSSDTCNEYITNILKVYSQDKILEELFAYISGHIHAGRDDADFVSMFDDFDAVKNAWNIFFSEEKEHKK